MVRTAAHAVRAKLPKQLISMRNRSRLSLSPRIQRAALLFAIAALYSIARDGAGAEPAGTPPAPQPWMMQRHAEKIEAVKSHKYDLLLVGDSITQNLERPEFAAVWNTYFAPRNAIDLGYSGARANNLSWYLANGELEGQNPKVVTVLVGGNNADDANFPSADTPEQTFTDTAALIQLIRERCPGAKILLLKVFPRENKYTNPDGSERGDAAQRLARVRKTGELDAKLADGKTVFFLDVNHCFIKLDGSIDPAKMSDLVHPSPEGALAWAQAMEPLLAELFGDEQHGDRPSNTALIPRSKLENDFYDWWERHAAVLKLKEDINPETVLIGDSITHLWGGQPAWSCDPNGAEAFAKTFAGERVLNMGFGYDRVQNVLWRLDHGELDGLHPDNIVINIGTNNLHKTNNAPENTPAEIAEGIREVLLRVKSKTPDSHIFLMGIFPRGAKPSDPDRAKIAELNKSISEYGKTPGITYLDIGDKLVQPDGSISPQMMRDFLHPTELGYEIWGSALKSAGL